MGMDISGAVVVSTPQTVALIDARKAVSMFKAVNIPIIGLAENMSAFCCGHCGKETPIFGDENASRDLATQVGVDFLGGVPLEPEIMRSSDRGTPLVVSKPESISAKCYVQLADKVAQFLGFNSEI